MKRAMFKQMAMAALMGAAAGIASPAGAAVQFIADQAAFSALGTITQTTDFAAYTAEFTPMPASFTVGDLTVTTPAGGVVFAQGYVLGEETGLQHATFFELGNVGTTVQLGGPHSLFGVNLVNLGFTADANFTVTTNLGSYQFATPVGGSSSTPVFAGFQSSAGETITSVFYSGSDNPGATSFQIGQVGAAPEPATWAMLILGFGIAGAALRRRRRADPAGLAFA